MTGDTIRREDLIEWSGLPVGKTCALCGNGPGAGRVKWWKEADKPGSARWVCGACYAGLNGSAVEAMPPTPAVTPEAVRQADDEAPGPVEETPRPRQPPREGIHQALQLLAPPGGVFEVRSLGDRIASGYFDADHIPEAADKIEALDAAGTYRGIYVTLNPVHPALLSRRSNRIETRLPRDAATTADADIIRRWWFPVDIDPKRPSGISSTDEEHAAALDVAGKVAGFLTEICGFPAPIRADSGNGAHLDYRIDLPNDDECRTLIERCLKALAAAFDRPPAEDQPGWEIDQTVFNAARIWKLYGTMCRKGDHTPQRPHRRARILAVPPAIEVVPREALERLAALAPEEERPAQPTRSRSGGSGPDLDEWLREYGGSLPRYQAKSNPGCRSFYVFDVCPWDSSHRDRSAFMGQLTSGPLIAGCHHNGCSGNGWADLRALVEPKHPKPAAVRREEREPSPTPAATAPEEDGAPAPAPDADGLEAEAREILTAGDPIAYLLDTFHTEHVRDAPIAKCCYVSAASRMVEDTHGLHVLTIGPSGKGKSSSYSTVRKQTPEASQIAGTLTDKALFYHDIPDKAVLVLDDKAMSEGLQQLFRGATSDFRTPEPLRTVGPKREPIVMTLPPRCVWWMASADDVADEQFHNRCLQPWCDDSDEADREFFEHMLNVEAFGDDASAARQFAVCRAMWRLIEAEVLPVWVWFTPAIRFGDQRNRRNGKIFVDIIKAFARIRFMQRPRDARGRVVATLEDFRDALTLYHELTSEAGSQVNQLTPDEARILRLIEMMHRDSFTRNDLVGASGLPAQRVYRILHGRPERGTGGLLEKCPAITDQEVNVSMDTDGIRRGHREKRYYFDTAVYRTWSGRGAVEIDRERCKGVFSQISQSFPSLFPSWEKTLAALNPSSFPIREREREREREEREGYPNTRDSTPPPPPTPAPLGVCVCAPGKWEKTPISQMAEEAVTPPINKQGSEDAGMVPSPVGKRLGKDMGNTWEKTPQSQKRDDTPTPLPGAIDPDDLIPAKPNTERCQVCQVRPADLKSKDGHVWICSVCQRVILRARAREMGMTP